MIKRSIWYLIGWVISVCAPPPPPLPVRYNPRLRSRCHYIVNYYVKIWHVRLGGAHNMHPLSWGEGAQTEKIQILLQLGVSKIGVLLINEKNSISTLWLCTRYGPKQIVNGTMGVSEVMTVFFSVLLGALSVGQAVPIFGLITSVAASYSFIHSIINRVITNDRLSHYSTQAKLKPPIKEYSLDQNKEFPGSRFNQI